MSQSINLYVVEPRSTGGMIHYAYQLCNSLAQEGATVTLVTAKDYEMENFEHNFRVVKLLSLWSSDSTRPAKLARNPLDQAYQKTFRKIRRVFRGIRYVFEWVHLTSYLLNARPDIIQFGKIEFPFEAIFLWFIKKRGIVLSQICHEFEHREAANNPVTIVYNRLFQWVYQSFSILFFHGQSNLDRFLTIFQVPESELFTIPHGNEQLFSSTDTQTVSADLMREKYGFGNAPVILFFGIIAPSKGVPDLLRAFRDVNKLAPQSRLLIAGKPTKYIEMNDLVSQAKELGIENSTTFDLRYIPLEEVSPLMKMASVVVYPYINSSQSGSLQVAYTFERPVIATKVGGLPEAVEDGKSGFLVQPEAPEELAGAILKFVENPNLTEEMGAYAKHLSETRFSWGPIARKILEVYDGFIRPQPPHSDLQAG